MPVKNHIHLPKITDVPDPESMEGVQEDPNLLHSIGVPLIAELIEGFINPLHRHVELIEEFS
jgi:hypothetical protein